MPSIQEPLHFKPEEPKVVVAQNEKMVDVQDKEVTMEGLCSVAAYDLWTPLSVPGQRPKPRYKHGAAVVQEKMYVFGGNHNGRYLGDIQVLDFKSLSWSKLEAKIQSESSESAEPVLVAPCAGHSLSSRGGQSVTRIGDTLVVFGGEGDGRSLLNDLHVLDLETMTWDEFESTGTPPSPRSEHAAACYADRYLLIFGGGSHSTCFSDLYLLDMQTMEWSRPEQHGIIPEPRAGHAGVTVGDNWVITGGGNSKKGVPETLVLNMSTLVWSVVTSFEGRAPPTSENNKGGDISKTLVQAVKREKNQVEEKLEQEKLQSFHLKKELADVENKNAELTKELQSVRDQLSDEATRASKLEDEVSEIQQRLQKMQTLEKEFELLRSERGGGSDKSGSGSNKRPGSVGFRRWYGDDES